MNMAMNWVSLLFFFRWKHPENQTLAFAALVLLLRRMAAARAATISGTNPTKP